MNEIDLEEFYKDIVLDKFHAHEALDRTFLANEIFESYVIEHPFVFKNEKLRNSAKEILEAMFDLYQMISKESLDLYDH